MFRTPRTRANLWFVVSAIVLLSPSGMAGIPSPAQETHRIFQLGQLDGSSQEFRPGSPTEVVRVDSQNAAAASEWYGFQPIDARPGITAAPREITFRISETPVMAYTMRIAVLIERASVPALRVNVDGHEGIFYLDPKLDYRVDNGAAVSFPAFSQAVVSFKIPGTFLHEGENTIALSAVAQGDGGQIPNAGFNYDAIAMFEGAPAVAASEVRIQPTVFYKQEGARLEEGIDVTLRHGDLPIRSASLIINGLRVTMRSNGSHWGEQRERLFVPAFTPHTRVKIDLDRGGKIDSTEESIDPAKRWTVYVVPHVHLDIGYTDYQAKVAAVQSRVIDEALDLIDLHPEFRFSVDGMWSVEQFMNTRTAADKARAIHAMKAQRLFAPAEYANELTGFASTETLIRSLYAGAQFSRANGTPLDYANITDVPSYSWSYASILASAGIHELIAGANDGRAPVLLRGHLDETSPFYWQGPDGQKMLMWYSRHYHQMWTIFGLPPLVNAGEQTLPLFLQLYGRPTYKASSTMLCGSQVENTDLFPEQAELVEQWNRKYAYPHLKYSGFNEALTSIASEFHGDIPTVRGDGGPYWEDGIAADAYYASMERETEARALSAEKFSTIASLENSRLAPDKGRLDAMWRNMVLMDEHTWTAARSYSDNESDQATVQLAVKDAKAIHAHEQCDWLLRNSMADLADSINTPAHSLVVFNSLSWKRSGMVEIDIDKGYGIFDSTTGRTVPIEVNSHGEYTNRVRFWAEDIPAVGYRTYLLRPAQPASDKKRITASVVMENNFYRVELDPATGAVRSIFDKELRRELVNQSSPYRLGEYLYVTTNNARQGADRFVVHGTSGGKLISVDRTPEGITAHLLSSNVNTPRIATTITLSNREKKILFTEDVDKTETKSDEAVYFAFPFAMAHPQFEYEIQNGVVDPSRDMYPGAGLDWFSVQHWAAVQQDGISAAVMPLDASLMTFGDISRVSFPETFGVRKGTIFSYVMNNYWHTNYRATQGGHFRFRYVVTSASSINPSDLSRRAWEEMTPLEVTEVTPSDKALQLKRPLDAKSMSFLSTEDPSLLLETWKAAEDGRGTILRFLDLGGTDRTVRVSLPLITIEHAWLTDALERDERTLTPIDAHQLDLKVTPHAILTVRVLNKITQKPLCGRYCATK